ncbi:MAG: HAD domain-containing protein [Psychrobacter sp.]|nr:HAD domain-containing protein [Psychrobacter sp.]
MKILLDFDGVMVITPTWRPVEQADDGFMTFDEVCAANLAEIVAQTGADIVLTTTHRIHYDNETWRTLLANRGIHTNNVSKVNVASQFTELGNRCEEVLAWVAANPNEHFVIIDDDKSLRGLPEHIKGKWVETSFHDGLTEKRKAQTLAILLTNS